MAMEWCKPCRDRGRLSVAHHEVAGTMMCDECFEGKPSNGVRPTDLVAKVLKKKAEGKTMAKRIDDATKAAIRKDAAEGMNYNAIAKKQGVGWGTVRDAIDENGKKGAGGGRPKSSAAARRGRPSKSANGNGGVTLTATPELCDGIWAALPLEKKAALLNRLHEAN